MIPLMDAWTTRASPDGPGDRTLHWKSSSTPRMTCAGAGYAGWGHHRGNSACIAGSKAKMLRTAGGDAIAVLAEQGADDRDVARAGPDEGVADHQAAAHMPLGIGEAMGRGGRPRAGT